MERRGDRIGFFLCFSSYSGQFVQFQGIRDVGREFLVVSFQFIRGRRRIGLWFFVLGGIRGTRFVGVRIFIFIKGVVCGFSVFFFYMNEELSIARVFFFGDIGQRVLLQIIQGKSQKFFLVVQGGVVLGLFALFYRRWFQFGRGLGFWFCFFFGGRI